MLPCGEWVIRDADSLQYRALDDTRNNMPDSVVATFDTHPKR